MRNPAFEARFLEDVVQTAQRLTGILPLAYPGRVRQRLALGEQRYPGDKWLTRANVEEAAQEPADVAGYGVLELQRLLADGHDPDFIAEQRLDLLAASAYAAISDWYLLRALRREVGEE